MFEDLDFRPQKLAWNNLTNDELNLILNDKNPTILENRSKDELLFPGTREIAIMKNFQEYIYFAARVLLNIHLTPMQQCMQYCLWCHNFPLLIASRGASKMLKPDELIKTPGGWTMMKDIQIGDRVYGRDGKLCNVTDKTDLKKDQVFYRLTLRDGRQIDACEDHLWKVWDKNKNKRWKGRQRPANWTVVDTKTIAQKYYYDRKDSKSKDPTKRCKEYLYALPIAEELESGPDIDLPIHPYLMGMLLGDGGMTTNSITITTADQEVVENIRETLPYGYKLVKLSSKFGYQISIDKTTGIVDGFHNLLRPLGIWGHKSIDKFIPEVYKHASNAQKLELVKGLMDADGCSCANDIYLATSSPKLANDFIDITRSLGFHSCMCRYEAYLGEVKHHDTYSVKLYTDKPVFKLSRKLHYVDHIKSKAGQSRYDKVFITNVERIENSDGYCITVDSPDHTYITKDYIVTHNSFSLALYAMLRAALCPGTKVVCVGASFRQSKILYSYVADIWKNAHVLQSIYKSKPDGARTAQDMITFALGDSKLYFCPLGTGDKIRGLRANIVIADELNSINTDVYQIVVKNFAAVSKDPVNTMKRKSELQYLKTHNLEIPEDLLEDISGNQSIVAGTMGFQFEPMYEYWQKYKKIIETKGECLTEKNPDGSKVIAEAEDDALSYKDFCIMRLPYELIPKGFMDDKVIAEAKATIHVGAYNSEFGCVPITDTTGFFRHSIIEQCVAHDRTVGSDGWPNWCPTSFDTKTRGSSNAQYVLGIDPAADADNFAITLIEVHPEHQRVVYCWTTNRETVRQLDPEANYWTFCARFIRMLMRAFNIVRIGIDSQGGGGPLCETLHDKELLKEGERPLWPVIDYDKPQDTDLMAGDHIIEIINFANYKWLAAANHNLRKDFESRTILFPRYDSVILGLESVNKSKNSLDMEEAIINIQELKKELALIVMEKTPSGRERWDTPQVKTETNKVGRLRKDRYSSLLIANALAREINKDLQPDYEIEYYGGMVGNIKHNDEETESVLYYGNTELAKDIGNPGYCMVQRG